MNDIDNINPCAFSDEDFGAVGSRLNTVFNVVGIMFLLTTLTYLTLHCL